MPAPKDAFWLHKLNGNYEKVFKENATGEESKRVADLGRGIHMLKKQAAEMQIERMRLIKRVYHRAYKRKQQREKNATDGRGSKPRGGLPKEDSCGEGFQ